MYDHFHFPQVEYGWLLVTVTYFSLAAFPLRLTSLWFMWSPLWLWGLHVNTANDTQPSLPRLPLQGVSHEQVLSPEAVLEGQAGETREHQHTGRALQEATGVTLLWYDYTSRTRSVLQCYFEKIFFVPLPSMQQSWSRSRTIQRTRSSWGKWLNTVASFRYFY